jgi:hypothetical protein
MIYWLLLDRLRRRLLLSRQFPQTLLQVGSLQRAADPVNDISVRIDEHRSRHSVIDAKILQAIERCAHHHGQRVTLVPLDERFYLRLHVVIINRRGDEQHPALVALLHLAQQRHLRGAGHAPRGPEVQHNGLAAIVFELVRSAFQVAQFEAGRGLLRVCERGDQPDKNCHG